MLEGLGGNLDRMDRLVDPLDNSDGLLLPGIDPLA